jgi:D-psicose/D-tagatose/L-ribulose 3-epimerase
MHDRLGFSFLYFAPRITEQHEPWFARLKANGYACAELPIVDASDAELAWLRNCAEREGLKATAVGFATPQANPVSPDPEVRRAAVRHLQRLCEKAQALGADVLAGPMHSAYGVWTEAPPTADERQWCRDVLREAAEHAAQCGVKLAIEPLNRFESYFLNTAADCVSLVQDVAHENLSAALDTHHAHLEECDLIDAIRASKGALGHVQLSENHRGTPGTGQVAFAAVLAALAEIDYRGWLVVEAFSRQDPAFGSMLRIWRSLDDGPEAVMAAGAALLRATS